MKRTIFTLMVLLAIGMQMTFAQNKQHDYNIEKALELLENNNETEAMKYINKQIEENPKSVDAYVLRAKVFKAQEKYGSALTDINKALSVWKKGSPLEKYTVYWWRADIYTDMKMYDKAIADFEFVIKDLGKKDDKELLYTALSQRAQLHYEMKDYAKSDTDYNLMLKYDEANQLAMIGLIRNMIMREDYNGAISMANLCDKYDNSYSEIYRFRMQAYDKLGKTDDAIDDAIRYFETDENPQSSLMEPIFKQHPSYALAKVNGKISSDSENSVSWRMLRITLYEMGYDYVNAIAEYNALEKEYGASQAIYYHRSNCYNEIGDYEHAIADITKEIEMGDGKDYLSLSHRADIYRESGRYDKAIIDCTKMIELIPTYAYAYYQRGWCYELSGDDEAAMQNYNAGIDVDKTYPYIFLMRGELHRKQGHDNLAKADFEEVIKLDTIIEKGSCRQYALHFLNRNDEALEWMEKLVASAPENNGIYYDKACLLARMGKLEESINALRISLEKGNRAFAHIEHDNDMDPIREHPEFIALIAEYKAKPIQSIIANEGKPDDEIAVISEIQMKKMYSGVYEVPCAINGLTLKFIFDTGASSVSISSVEASFMLKNGYLKEGDIKGKQYFSTATGEIHEGTTICLREIQIGDAILRNVDASVANNQQAPLLLGQSVLERFGTITIDNINSKLIIKQ